MVDKNNFDYNPTLTNLLDKKIHKLENKLCSQKQQIRKLTESFYCLKLDNYNKDICGKKNSKFFRINIEK